MLQIVTTPLHNCQKFVSKRVETDAVFINKKTQTFCKKCHFWKITFEFDHFVRYFSLNISSGSLLAFFSFLWFASDVLLILSNLKI